MMLLLTAGCAQKKSPDTEPPSSEPEATSSNEDFFEKFRKKGVDFYATGNEPFWALEIDHSGGLTFHMLEGFRAEQSGPCEPSALADGNGYAYTANTPEGSVQVTVLRQLCVDSMSGDSIPYKVAVQIKKVDQTSVSYSGCGRYLNDPGIAGTWRLTQLNGQPVDTAGLMKGAPTLQFSPSEYRIWGHGSCNNYFGQADLMGDRLAVSNRVGSTLMACPNMELENIFFKTLPGKTFMLNLHNQQLTLMEGQKPVMQWVRSNP
ncbi:MAG: META domain-containing protein [Chitinophagales bacterium]|nr:META domain-containing protein [Chitinophagales bacterium]MDW8394149.1 META domain-containing protein [Chitinophagales bacterium]